MYDPPGGALFGGGAVGAAGALALTGFSALFFAFVALALILLGAILVRSMSIRVDRGGIPGGDATRGRRSVSGTDRGAR